MLHFGVLSEFQALYFSNYFLLDFQKKQADDESTPSTSNSQSDLFSEETNSDNSNTSLSTQTVNSSQQLSTELNVTSPSKEECKCSIQDKEKNKLNTSYSTFSP